MSRLSYRLGVPRSLLEGRPTPLTFVWRGEQVTALLSSPWQDDDVAAVLAVQQAEDESCPGCGAHLSKSTDDDLQRHWDAEVVRCHNCKARADALDGADVKNRNGLLVRSRFTDEPDAWRAR